MPIDALDNRVTRLEGQIAAGFERIEKMLRAEINDLKTEQISDLREANKRLADDQRRSWERLTEFERRENERIGGNKVVGSISHFLAVIMGGMVTWLATWLAAFKGLPPR